MSPRTRHSLFLASAAVALAAIAGIAAIEGWLPDSGGRPAPPAFRVAGTAPPESLSPGETVVSGQEKPAAPAPSATPAPARSAEPPAPAAAPVQPARPATQPPRRRCPQCGTISSTAYYERELRGAPWEVRVKFDDGSRKIFRYPTDPGFHVGDRVILSHGRLQKD